MTQPNETRTRTQALQALTAAGQPYELIDLPVGARTLKVFRHAPRSLRELYASTASEQPFIVYRDERLSFAQAWQRAGAIGHLLVDRYGIRKGDRVAIAMRNYPEWMLVFCAVTSIGAIAVALNALWLPPELEYALDDCGARVLFADQERLERLAQCEPLDVQVIAVRPVGDDPDVPSLAALLDARTDRQRDRQRSADDTPPAVRPGPAAPAVMPPADIESDDPATIFYTSGSSGHPKGVLTSHRSILSALLSWELDGKVGEWVSGVTPPVPPLQTATLLAVPLFHATGSHAVYLMCYRLQRRLVSMHKWDPAEAAELIERERITSVVAPSAMTGDLVREARRTQRDLSSLLIVGGGGAARAPEQVRQIAEVFPVTLPATGWGMTETNAIGTGIIGPDYLQHPASSGRCSAVLELRVIDESGRVLAPGERGELQVRGSAMFIGYWNRPELNDTLFDDGWFSTGDVACLDADGYLFIVDRIKDLIIRGGENIGCGQVESALLEHPAVHEAAVYAVPDERLGEEVGATVHGAAGLDPEQLRQFLMERLARFEVPRFIRLEPAPLPRTASGKILKRQLRAEAIAEMLPSRSTE